MQHPFLDLFQKITCKRVIKQIVILITSTIILIGINVVLSIEESTRKMDLLNNQPLVQLRYSIAEASSYSGAYAPQNILYDRPHDMRSRWTGAAVANMVASSIGMSSTANSNTESSGPSLMTSRDGGYSLGRSTTAGQGASINTNASTAIPIAGINKGIGSPTSNSTLIGGGLTEKQYLILKLEKPAILKKIYFGKFHKSHPCNLKDFKIYGSASTRDPKSKAWVRLVRGVLKNDAIPETFETRYTTADGVPFPVRYIKLVPLATHLPNYNFSIWYVALEGISNPNVVSQISAAFHQHRESVALRLILKHLRSRAYHSAYRILLESCGLDAQNNDKELPTIGPKRPFERPVVTQLFHALMQGSWDVAEACLERAAWGEQNVGSVASSMEGSGDSEPYVHQGFAEAGQHIDTAASLLSAYVDRSIPKPVWHQVHSTDLNGDTPSGRGGHQMELDSDKGILWLFGGWDGSKDLADLWAFHIRESRWRCISRDVRQQGGPGPRSCHNMVFDPRTGFLYILGKYVDYDRIPSPARGSSPGNIASDRTGAADNGLAPSSAARGMFLPRFPGGPSMPESTNIRAEGEEAGLFTSNRGGHMRLMASTGRNMASAEPDLGRSETSMPGESQSLMDERQPQIKTGYESDFYRFSTRTERWDRLSFNTHAEGGPKLIFDHQMLIDPETQMLYVFGGRVAHPDVNKIELSGMWQYDVIQRSWQFIFDDNTIPHARIPARVGHTMLLDTPKTGSMAGKRILWILAGQRGTTYLADMWTYQINTGIVREISRDYSQSGPEGGFTQRATIDTQKREIHLFSGLVRKSKNKGERVKSAFWVYNIERSEWKLLYQHGGTGSALRPEQQENEETAFNNGEGEDDTPNEPVEPGRGPTQAFPIIDESRLFESGRARNVPARDQSMEPDIPMTLRDNSPAVLPGSPHPGAINAADNTGSSSVEPRPRFAAQMVYDNKKGNFYIFGGNPAESNSPAIRLDDLWCLDLVRPSISEILRRAKFKLRKQRFLEMAQEADQIDGGPGGLGAMQALIYLQTQVSQVVNHDEPEESQAFRRLMAHLLNAGSGAGRESTSSSSNRTHPSINLSSDPLFSSDGSSPWMSPVPGVSVTAEIGTFANPRSDDDPASLSVLSSDRKGLSSASGEQNSDSEGDSEMLSISQVLPQNEKAAEVNQTATSINNLESSSNVSASARQLALEGQPTALYRQRYHLFRSLCQFFPPNGVEPNLDLLDCVEVSKLTF